MRDVFLVFKLLMLVECLYHMGSSWLSNFFQNFLLLNSTYYFWWRLSMILKSRCSWFNGFRLLLGQTDDFIIFLRLKLWLSAYYTIKFVIFWTVWKSISPISTTSTITLTLNSLSQLLISAILQITNFNVIAFVLTKWSNGDRWAWGIKLKFAIYRIFIFLIALWINTFVDVKY